MLHTCDNEIRVRSSEKHGWPPSAFPVGSADRSPIKQAGFTLVMMSILLTVAALIFVAVLPGQEAGDTNQKNTNSTKKLERVEEAMRAFMTLNGRRPCPADGNQAEGAASFGVESISSGVCNTSTSGMLGPDAGTTYIVGGTIPTKTLGLPDDYAFDDYGRRFTYVVDTRATASGTCISLMNYPTNNGTGGIAIQNTVTANGGVPIDQTMYAYISHGATGYGAFPAQGSTVTNRVNSGSTDTDMQNNAGVNSSFTYNTTNFTNVFVKKDKVASNLPTGGTDTGFDDVVWYRPDLKNTCCLGTACTKYKAITIASNSGGYISTDLLNFPLLVAFYGDTNVGAAASATNCQNIRFTASDGVTQLPYERQTCGISGGAATGAFWVRVPVISHSADTIIYMYYGNANLPDGNNPVGVWDSNYMGVWHMEQLPSGTAPQMTDSTVNANNGTTGGTITQTTGQVGKALNYDGSTAYVNVGTMPAMFNASNTVMTLSCWILSNDFTSTPANGQAFFGTENLNTNYNVRAMFGWNGSLHNAIYLVFAPGVWPNDYAYVYSVATALSTGTWYHVAIVLNLASRLSSQVYVNGSAVASTVITGGAIPTAFSTVGTNVDWGAFDRLDGVGGNRTYFNGKLDECRISNTTRSADWISFEYHNMFDVTNDIHIWPEQ